MRTPISTLIAATGLALSVWLAMLKILELPCWGGGCAAVIYSSYGRLAGIPLGWFGAGLWIGVFSLKDSRGRLACLGALALGSAAFVALQVFVLRALCPYCLLHACATWAALYFWRTPPKAWGEVLGIAAAAILTAAAIHPGKAAAPEPSRLRTWMQRQSDGAYWLGERSPASPVLVLGLDCPACLDKLAEFGRVDFSGRKHGPALYFKTDPADREATTVLVAAVLAQGGGRREAFLGVTALALAQKDLLLSDPQGAARVLRGLFPGAAGREAEAAAWVGRESAQLESAGIETTPLLIAPSGMALTSFAARDVFPR